MLSCWLIGSLEENSAQPSLWSSNKKRQKKENPLFSGNAFKFTTFGGPVGDPP